jgi:hypothetical protein
VLAQGMSGIVTISTGHASSGSTLNLPCKLVCILLMIVVSKGQTPVRLA